MNRLSTLTFAAAPAQPLPAALSTRNGHVLVRGFAAFNGIGARWGGGSYP